MAAAEEFSAPSLPELLRPQGFARLRPAAMQQALALPPAALADPALVQEFVGTHA